MPQPATIGERIRTYRERLELSQEELASQSGFDCSLIAAIEEGSVYPALGTLTRLARTLGQRLGTFMDDQFKPDPLIMRAADRQESARPTHKEQAAGFNYIPLSSGKTDRLLDGFHIEIAADAPGQYSTHEGEEFIMVLTGEVELIYGDATYLLGPGDSAHYNSVVKHLVRASGGQPATLHAVVFVPY